MFDPGSSLNSRAIDPPSMRCTDVPQFTALQMAASRFRKDPKLHLKHLLADAFRSQGLMAVHKTSPPFENGVMSSSAAGAGAGGGGGGGSSAPDGGGRNLSDPFLLRRESSGTFGVADNNGGGGDGGSNIDAVSRWGRGGAGGQRRIILDYSRQHVTGETMELLFDLADRMGLTERMNEMRSGMHINFTERKAAMHHVLRMPRDYDFRARHPRGDALLGGVHSALGRIARFSEEVREGRATGCTGRELRNVVCIGIGGSHAGPEAVYAALRGDAAASLATEGRGTTLRFVANVDPVDFDMNTRDLHPEETLFIVTSKSFTTAETMQNARTARRWLVRMIGKTLDEASPDLAEADIIARHFCAVTMSPDEAEKFGICKENIFPIWEWAGGRFSVWSAAGILPLSIHYSYDVTKRLLDGAHDVSHLIFTQCMHCLCHGAKNALLSHLSLVLRRIRLMSISSMLPLEETFPYCWVCSAYGTRRSWAIIPGLYSPIRMHCGCFLPLCKSLIWKGESMAHSLPMDCSLSSSLPPISIQQSTPHITIALHSLNPTTEKKQRQAGDRGRPPAALPRRRNRLRRGRLQRPALPLPAPPPGSPRSL